jgi:ribose transport system permease protein
VIAVYLLAAGVTGLQQLGVPSWVEYVFNGTALLLSVILSGYAARVRAGGRANQPSSTAPNKESE